MFFDVFYVEFLINIRVLGIVFWYVLIVFRLIIIFYLRYLGIYVFGVFVLNYEVDVWVRE